MMEPSSDMFTFSSHLCVYTKTEEQSNHGVLYLYNACLLIINHSAHMRDMDNRNSYTVAALIRVKQRGCISVQVIKNTVL